MKAVVLDRHGGRECLRPTEMPDPVAGPGDVLVRIRYCGVNRVDILAREGRAPLSVPFPHILGCEISGDVEVLGRDVQVPGLAVGQRVAVLTRLACGLCEHCLAGDDNVCVKARAIGRDASGGYAEMIRIPAQNAIPLPASVTYEDAAASAMSMLTAWHMLVGRARLQPGETVLVMAAGSGIGSAAVQIGRLIGATVIAAAGTAEKCERALQIGAHSAINYSEQDLVTEVRTLTGKRGVDVVFEHVGAATFKASMASLTRNGRLVTCGATTGGTVELDLWSLFAKQLSVIGSYLGTRRELHDLLKVLAQGKLKPIIYRKLPLHEAAEAHRLLEEREQFGKVLLQI